MSTDSKELPFVRVVVLNYNGGDVTIECIKSLLNIDYPKSRFEIVVIDNASVDGLDWKIPMYFPEVRYIFSESNEGFARGCNIGMHSLEQIDAVALVNNDARVSPNFLRVLIETLFSESEIGAVSPLMLLDVDAVGLSIKTDPDVCLRLSGAVLPSADQTDQYQVSSNWQITRKATYLRGCGDVWWPVNREVIHGRISLQMSADKDSAVQISNGTETQHVSVGVQPVWHTVNISVPKVKIINNAGSVVTKDWYGGDRGFKFIDRGQFDKTEEVLAFCGGAVLLKSTFLRDVGLFEPSYFLYYEDTELSLRGKRFGWRYVYVPATTVAHRHAFSSIENSSFFNFWVDRNRRLTLIRHAPTRVALHATFTILSDYSLRVLTRLGRVLKRRTLTPLKPLVRDLREMASCLKSLPSSYVARLRYWKSSRTQIDFSLWLVDGVSECE
jgi:GT2 family glycosyltransferase